MWLCYIDLNKMYKKIRINYERILNPLLLSNEFKKKIILLKDLWPRINKWKGKKKSIEQEND